MGRRGRRWGGWRGDYGGFGRWRVDGWDGMGWDDGVLVIEGRWMWGSTSYGPAHLRREDT